MGRDLSVPRRKNRNGSDEYAAVMASLHSQYRTCSAKLYGKRHDGVIPLGGLLSLSCHTLCSGLILTGGDIQGRLPFDILSDYPHYVRLSWGSC